MSNVCKTCGKPLTLGLDKYYPCEYCLNKNPSGGRSTLEKVIKNSLGEEIPIYGYKPYDQFGLKPGDIAYLDPNNPPDGVIFKSGAKGRIITKSTDTSEPTISIKLYDPYSKTYKNIEEYNTN